MPRPTVLAIAASLVLVPGSATAQRFEPRVDPPWERPAEPDGSGVKVCSIYAPNNWRDTFQVPASWTAEDCQQAARVLGAPIANIGCLFDGGSVPFSFATPPGVPDPDCGWGEGQADDQPQSDERPREDRRR